MTDPNLFWTVFAAVLGANLLTVCFVWACINISRREERKESLGLYLGCAMMPLLFLIAGLYTAL
jgi:predicted membrane channel-forming protein YqfA (hemolysin III family)